MKKIILWSIPIILIIISVTFSLHFYNITQPHKNLLEDKNYEIQIAYNLIFTIISISALLIAFVQLSKTREATNVQSLTDFFNNIKSKQLYEKRKHLADYILLKQGLDECGIYKVKKTLREYKNLDSFTDDQKQEIVRIKNLFEDVIYEFVPLSYYFRKKKLYEIEDIYFLFSYEIQRLWLLVTELGYIDFIRYNKVDGEKDFYKGLEKLFNETLKQEIIENEKISFVNRVFYSKFLRLDNLLGCEQNSFKEKLDKLKDKKRNNIDLFLLEESKLQISN
jgi:hypothetical protein